MAQSKKQQHPLSTTVFRSRRQLHQVCPPWHHSHGNSSESGGRACPGPGGQTDSAREPTTVASDLTIHRTRWHFTGVIAGSLRISQALHCRFLSYQSLLYFRHTLSCVEHFPTNSPFHEEENRKSLRSLLQSCHYGDFMPCCYFSYTCT